MTAAKRRVVLITGASRGIGRAVADALASDWRVLVGGTRIETVQPVVDLLPDAAPFVADLTDPMAVANAAAELDSLDAVEGRVLGIVPLAADGSFHVTVPADRLLHCQILDSSSSTLLPWPI